MAACGAGAAAGHAGDRIPAKALGLTVPLTLRVRADELIE